MLTCNKIFASASIIDIHKNYIQNQKNKPNKIMCFVFKQKKFKHILIIFFQSYFLSSTCWLANPTFKHGDICTY